jgi:hypothetical protein
MPRRNDPVIPISLVLISLMLIALFMLVREGCS